MYGYSVLARPSYTFWPPASPLAHFSAQCARIAKVSDNVSATQPSYVSFYIIG